MLVVKLSHSLVGKLSHSFQVYTMYTIHDLASWIASVRASQAGVKDSAKCILVGRYPGKN